VGVRRFRKPIGPERHDQQTRTWLSSLSAQNVTARDIGDALRGRSTVENGILRLRDVSHEENRLHGNKIARRYVFRFAFKVLGLASHPSHSRADWSSRKGLTPHSGPQMRLQ
jgi:hypothetical protein